ncbi:MAG: FixH family protein [Deinococcota bacterium]|nr:FixH family protein [Deinococcota bacterium]
MKSLRHLLAKLILWLGAMTMATTALAHATVVFGELLSQPQTPPAGEPFVLTMTLRDPTQLAVSDAIVHAEFRRLDEPESAEPVRTTFAQTERDGLYRAELSLPEGGSWNLLLRDQTYRQEETRAELVFKVAPESNPDALEFVFPPTQTASQTVFTWAMWLVGLPLLAGLVVTVIVLTGSKNQERAKES